MRVIAGLYKGRILKTVKDLSVRPATDRVKQTIFDMLTNRIDMQGIHVLDLFAGSGSLGIEALSRGAGHATFVENDHEAVRSIEHNIRTLGCEELATIEETDAMYFMSQVRPAFDLIFADPPYAFDRTQDIPEIIFERKIPKQRGYLLIEHTPDIHFAQTSLYDAGPEKKFGRTLVTFFQSRSENDMSNSANGHS